MDTAQLLVAVLGAGGGGAVLLALVNGVIKWLSGASSRERAKNSDLATQRTNAINERNEAERERDEADEKRRETEEYVSILRRQLIENNIQPAVRPLKQDPTIVEK